MDVDGDVKIDDLDELGDVIGGDSGDDGVESEGVGNDDEDSWFGVGVKDIILDESL